MTSNLLSQQNEMGAPKAEQVQKAKTLWKLLRNTNKQVGPKKILRKAQLTYKVT